MTEKPGSQQRLLRLHRETDERFAKSTENLPAPIGCGSGCFSCCVDDLTVWKPEADAIERYVIAHDLEIHIADAGVCAWLRDGRCQVYEARPYVCRSQGAVLRFWDGAAEVRDTCPEHLEEIVLSNLDDGQVFDLGPAEQQLAAIASAELGERGEKGLPDRVGLRELAIRLMRRTTD